MLVGERVRRRLRPLADGPAAQSPDGCDHDGGFTLVEVVITVALMSIAFVSILGSLGTMIATGSTHKAVTTGEVAVRDLAEFVKSQASVPYTDCGSNPLSSYSALVAAPGGFAAPAGFSAGVVSVKYWQGDGAGTFNATCPSPDAGAQLITVRITGGTGGRHATQVVDVVKRQP